MSNPGETGRGPAGPVVFVHIGPPKTGTTYLQAVLSRNRQRLLADGVRFRADRQHSHFLAALDLLGESAVGEHASMVQGAWERLAEDARSSPGTTVISHENLSGANPEQVLRAVESLAPATVHVVYTARDLSLVIPAAWQERLKNGSTQSWAGFMRELHRRSPTQSERPQSAFWRYHGGLALQRWSAAVPPERIHVVTVPPPGAPQSLLWERFAEVVGITDPQRYSTDLPRGNESIGVAEAAFLRQLNAALSPDAGPPTVRPDVKHYLAGRVLTGRPQARRIVLPGRQRDFVLTHAERLVKQIQSGGFDVVGDLDELLPAPPDADVPDDFEVVDDGEVLQVALDVVIGLLDHNTELRRRVRRSSPRPPQPPSVRVLVRRRLTAMAAGHRSTAGALRVYRRLRGVSARTRSGRT